MIGASRTPGKIGHEILRNLKMSGFRGDVFPVNPKVKSILDLKAYDRIGVNPSDGRFRCHRRAGRKGGTGLAGVR